MIRLGHYAALLILDSGPCFQLEIMQPVRSNMKMDAITWLEMFIALIFANNLAKSSIAGQHSFMPHGFNDRDVTADGNVTLGRLGSICKLHMFGSETKMNSPTLRNMASG